MNIKNEVFIIKKIIIFFILLLSTIAINSLEKRTALIIGNSNYSVGYLKNPINDAKAMAQTLKGIGFEVIMQLDLKTQNDMKKAVRNFGEIISKNKGISLFYYSGHGIQIKGINYLVPINAQITNEDYVEYECLDVGEVFTAMNIAGTKTNIVILDACRNNPFARNFRGGGDKGLAVIYESPSGTLIAFSTSPGSIASDGIGENGLYTGELIKTIKTPNIKLEDVFKIVRKNVSKRSNGQQIPWENSSLFEDFYFVKQESGEKLPITIEEKPLYGSIEIEVLENGKLYIDNKFICNVSAGKKITLNNITVGNHNIEIRYDDKVENKNVFVDKNKIIALSFSYRKQERPKMPDNFVFVKGGTFKMGSNDGDKDEKPVHNVTVDDFWISKYEVTLKEFSIFVNEIKYITTAEKGDGAYVCNNLNWGRKKDANWRNPYFKQTNDHPVTCINWIDAIEYCNWLSEKYGLTKCYIIKEDLIIWDLTASGFRLPTEAEWEFAARGGKYSKGYKFAGSNNLNEIAWCTAKIISRKNYTFDDASGYNTHPIGKKKPNELGIFDMSGNVFEWCWDLYGDYNKTDQKNPLGPKRNNIGSDHVLRGGSWIPSSTNVICLFVTGRGNGIYCEDYGADDGRGFRLARSTK